ncbi:MAG: fructosamine kinase family protein [Gammaproteobacteria bacterium]|nr:fructosamine kinase family protein [Gammaproteobacteria bacterium]NNF60334.1 phosphotransferase [Gammaproteobacteria bacterium]NNM20622.1 phosphotransferase [Gammaproteobacteria bacterium]
MRHAAGQRGIEVHPGSARRVAGGSINEAWRIDTSAGWWFVKFNTADRYDMFLAEAEGMAELHEANAVRVPRVECSGRDQDRAFLALEFVELSGGNNAAATRLGGALAQLHNLQRDYFGWHRDNTIGSTPQINTRCTDWVEFFRRHRLDFQLQLAARRGATRLAQSGARLSAQLERFFDGATIRPALLHGDLWGGNWGACGDEPVLFDPAVFYGDAESDIAMTELFGGFPREFYAAYRQQRPDQPGGAQRRELYRLYHVLNHYNLFGGGYGAQAGGMIEALTVA